MLETDLPDVAGIPNVPNWARLPFGALIALDNVALRRAIAAHGAHLLPLYRISRSRLAADPKNFSDGEHPSVLGSQRLADMLWPSFRAALAR